MESKTEEKIKPNKKSHQRFDGNEIQASGSTKFFFKKEEKNSLVRLGFFQTAAVFATFLIGSLFQGSENADQEQSTPIFVEGKPWTVPSISLEMLWCEPGVFYTNIFSQEKEKKKVFESVELL